MSNGNGGGRHRSRSGWLRNSFSKAFSKDKRSAGGGGKPSKGGSVSDAEDGSITNRMYSENQHTSENERPSSAMSKVPVEVGCLTHTL